MVWNYEDLQKRWGGGQPLINRREAAWATDGVTTRNSCRRRRRRGRAFPTEGTTTTDKGDMQEAAITESSLTNGRDDYDGQRGPSGGGSEGVESFQRKGRPRRTTGTSRRRRSGGRASPTEGTTMMDNEDLQEAGARGASFTNERDDHGGQRGLSGGGSEGVESFQQKGRPRQTTGTS